MMIILPWDDLKDESPVAFQILEKASGFKYDSLYGTMRNTHGQPITYEDIEEFFGDQGWNITVYPLADKKWNGIITDINGVYVFDDAQKFDACNSRTHAKALLTGAAMQIFDLFILEHMIKPILNDGSKTLIIERFKAAAEGTEALSLENLSWSDLNQGATDLASTYARMVVVDGDRGKIFKNANEEFPFINMIIPM